MQSKTSSGNYRRTVVRYIQNIELSICHKPFLNFEVLKLSLKTQDVFQNYSKKPLKPFIP